MSRGTGREEEEIAGGLRSCESLRRSERLVERASRIESSSKCDTEDDEARALTWDGVSPPCSGSDTTEYPRAGEYSSDETVTDTESEISTEIDLNTTVIDRTTLPMASGGPPTELTSGGPPTGVPSVGPHTVTTSTGPTTATTSVGPPTVRPSVPTPTGIPISGTGTVDIMGLMNMFMTNMREERQKDRESDEKRWKDMNKTTATPDTPKPTPQVTLPKLKEGGEIDTFIAAFETALNIAQVPEEEWKTRLVSNIPIESIVRIGSTVNVDDVDYEGLKWALLGCSQISYCTAAEDWSSGEKGKVFTKDVRAAGSRLMHLHKNLVREAVDHHQISEATVVARMREQLVPELKTYIDLSRRFEYHDFILACEEWARSQPGEVACFKQQAPPNQVHAKGTGSSHSQGSQPQNRPRPTCFSWSAGPVLLWWRQRQLPWLGRLHMLQ